MPSIDESVRVLSARLPELEWKLSVLHSVFNPNRLPRGLFLSQFEFTPQSCIDEIKADLRVLSDHKNERSAHYLAERISKKINVLVQLCKVPVKKHSPTTFGVQSISTRQQWLQTLEDDISRLSEQQRALTASFSRLQMGVDPQAVLSLQAELGEVERCLTLARETLTRAIG